MSRRGHIDEPPGDCMSDRGSLRFRSNSWEKLAESMHEMILTMGIGLMATSLHEELGVTGLNFR